MPTAPRSLSLYKPTHCPAVTSLCEAVHAIYKFIHHEGSTLGYIRYILKYRTDNYKEDRQSR